MLTDKIFLGLQDDDLKIFKVYKDTRHKLTTRITPLKTKVEGFRLLDSLGFKSSNLLFTNYVIWVEGHSDIFYYEAFLNMQGFLNDVRIKRGNHYEIMWYGGREEKHLFNMKSEDRLSILFSFTRKGAIFWDYDNKDLTKEQNKIIEKVRSINKNKDFGRNSFIVGYTGEILSNDGSYSHNKERPRTVENLMSKAAAMEALKIAYRSKRNKENIASKVAHNRKIEKSDVDKVRLGRAFLEYVNGLKQKSKNELGLKKELEKVYNETHKQIIKDFFKSLYRKIKNANNLHTNKCQM